MMKMPKVIISCFTLILLGSVISLIFSSCNPNSNKFTLPSNLTPIGEIEYGIRDNMDFIDLRRELKTTNGWVGIVEGKTFAVVAGYYWAEPEQGVIQLRYDDPGNPYIHLNFKCPDKAGKLTIESVEKSRVVLLAEKSEERYYFDLLARQYVSDLTVMIATATPLPTPLPDLRSLTPSPTWIPYPISTAEFDKAEKYTYP